MFLTEPKIYQLNAKPKLTASAYPINGSKLPQKLQNVGEFDVLSARKTSSQKLEYWRESGGHGYEVTWLGVTWLKLAGKFPLDSTLCKEAYSVSFIGRLFEMTAG